MTLSNGQPKVLDDVVFICFVYNQKKFVREAIDSAINQTCYPSRLIIMDDASSDGTQEVIEDVIKSAPSELTIEYWRNDQNLGLNAQLNKLSGQFENTLMVFQAGDDISEPTRVEETYACWLANDRPPLIVARYDEIDESGDMVSSFSASAKPQKKYTFKRLVNRRATIYGCCPAYHSQVFNHFGRIPSYIINDDRVNTFRALCLGNICYLHTSLLKYRVGIGVSFYDDVAKDDQLYRLVTDAKREVSDIKCHLSDLDAAPRKDKKYISKLLMRRNRFVMWLSALEQAPSFSDVMRAILSGVPIKPVWKAYKKLRK
jgi:glycosyltransferase involved in cell wall biosynthesis